MNLIQKVTRLEHPGVLRGFKWPSDLPTFGRFNLIYGWNGSGKTTLSRVFRDLEQRSVPSTGQAVLCIKGNDIDGDVFPQTSFHVRVFNRDFVNENVFPVDGGEVPPIFVVGKESADKQKEVDRLKKAKSAEDTRLDHARTTSRQADHELDKHCVDRAKVIKDTLRISGRGAYNDYDKRAYRSRMEKMAEAGDSEAHQLDDTTRDTLLVQHRETNKPKVQEVQYRLPDVEQLRDQIAAVRAATVAGSAIQALKDDPELGDWTHRGLKLHRERASQVCLFCEQPLSSSRLATLEAHFSAEHAGFLRRLDELLAQVKAATREADDLLLPNRAEFYEDITGDYGSCKEAFEEAVKNARDFADNLVGCLEEKRGQPYTNLQSDMIVPAIDGDVVDRLNEVIQRHNKACDEFQSRTEKARDHLADGIIAESFDDYSGLAIAAREARTAIHPIQEQVQRLSGEIARLEQEIVEHRQPAEELNEDLCKYLGHDELRLEVKETGYALVRHGVLADSLSDGERTALALLYFLKSLGDQRFDLKEGVVVVDDPVSSLDTNALYLAFGYIRQRTQAAGQLFLLTHNFTFFRQVRNWFHNLPGQRRKDINQRPARFYMLDRVVDANPRRTEIRPLDPLLERYESDYHYLFAYVHREAKLSDTQLEQAYVLPNIARRLLEMFLAFRRPQIAGELWKKLKDIEFDEAKKVRMLRFLHTHSHGDTIGAPEHDPSLLGEARSVLTDVMQFMKSEDPEHFKAMVDVVKLGTEAEEGAC